MRSRLIQVAFMAASILVVLCSASSPVFAGFCSGAAPEIDANLVSAGLGLAAAAVLMIRARRRR